MSASSLHISNLKTLGEKMGVVNLSQTLDMTLTTPSDMASSPLTIFEVMVSKTKHGRGDSLDNIRRDLHNSCDLVRIICV